MPWIDEIENQAITKEGAMGLSGAGWSEEQVNDNRTNDNRGVPAVIYTEIKVGAGASAYRVDSQGLYLGSEQFATAPFRVTMAGLLNATGATISGTITAALGSIGGWTIGTTTLSATGIVLDSTNQKITVGSGSEITIDGVNKKIESSNYVSGVFGSGFHIDSDFLEVGNMAMRGIIRTALFQKDVVSVVGGNLVVLDGDVLDADMTALDASTLTTKGTTTFTGGDILRIKDGTDDEWMEVTAVPGATNSGATSPGTMANVAVTGSYFSWVNPDNAKTSNNVYVTSSLQMTPLYDKVVSLVLADGSYGTENKKTGIEWVDTADTYFSYGGATDVWGETLTSADINDSDFGVILQIDQNGNAYSDYLRASNFGFTVPEGATINGIKVEIERNHIPGDGRAKIPQVDHIRITVYYTTVYSITRDKAGDYTPADTNPTWKKGATIVNYKQSGDGGVYMTASDTNAPYLSIFDHAGSPWTTTTTRLRIGNLNGYLGYSSDLYGIAIGETTKYLKYDTTNGLRIAGDITASTIGASTITGGTIRTAASGARVELTAANNRLDIYDATPTNYAWFGGTGASGTVIHIEVPSSGAYSPLYITSAGDANIIQLVNTKADVGYPQIAVATNGDADSAGIYSNATGGAGGIVGEANSNASVNTTGSAVLAIQNGTTSIYATNVAGCYCSKGGTWTDTSSKAMKENFTDITVLDKITNLDIKKYNYISEKRRTKNDIKESLIEIKKKEKYLEINSKQKGIKNDNEYLKQELTENELLEIDSKIDEEYSEEIKRPVQNHISPMAEDMYELFGIGDGIGLAAKDIAGIALQAIKELNDKIINLEKKYGK